MREAGLRPSQVVLELTERSVVRGSALTKDVHRLHQLGFGVALGDVGAGNAGLEMLRTLAVDFVKLDREVVARAVEDISARAVLLAIVAYARETGAAIIAEGVATESMLTFLRRVRDEPSHAEVRIAAAQGYLLGSPAELPTPVR